jgi:hypothetical protein
MAEDEDPQEPVGASLLDLDAGRAGSDEEASESVSAATTEVVEIPEAEDRRDEIARTATDSAIGSPTDGHGSPEVPVLVTPDPDGVAERADFAPVTTLPGVGAAEPKLIAMAERLARIERELARLTDRAGSGADAGEDRIVALERRVLHQVGSYRADLLVAIHDRFDRLESAIAEALADVRAGPGVPGGDEPA